MRSATAVENRAWPRAEPPYVDAIIKLLSGDIRTRVLDISRGGMAVSIPNSATVPPEGTRMSISLTYGDHNTQSTLVGDARTKRPWEEFRGLNKGKGVSIIFDKEITDTHPAYSFLAGIDQKTRLRSQRKLSTLDISLLSEYKGNLLNCQTNLFIVMLTVGAALASAYFALMYYGVTKIDTITNDTHLEFWRTMIAALPGLLAVACALMVAQKKITINKIEAYLGILKECTVRDQYPREYRGWETDSKSLVDVLGEKRHCGTCRREQVCRQQIEHAHEFSWKGLLKNPTVSLYYVIMNIVFFSAIFLSLIAITWQIPNYFHLGYIEYMLAGAAITAFLVSISGFLGYLLHELRKGKYSVDYFRKCWLHILTNCRQAC